jgi:aspartate/methionine/tyrosine aminotransferase
MHIEPFAIERFYERWEFTAELMLSSSDCEAYTVAELLALEPDSRERLVELRLGYTEVAGSAELRGAVAGGYARTAADGVLTLAAAEEGLFLANHALLAPGAHAVVEAPCYGSAIALARSTGAEVSVWQRRYEDGWAHDLDALEAMLEPSTRLIYINSPHNPTGTHMPADVFERVVELAAERGATLIGDEVYRGLEHDAETRLPAVCDAYEHGISLGAVSKAHGLAGLRVAWLASRDARLLDRVKDLKLYTTICSSAPSELLIALALRHAEQLVARSRELVLGNLPLMDEFVARRGELIEWVRPTAGPIGFPRVRPECDVERWCERTAERAGVLVLPGTVYGEPRHLRLGFGRANLRQALERLDAYLDAPG